ncbi:MAG: 30S ribosomal protein S20 [Elusimicrobiaceae bacterium]|jgi:small subunit ribosomal protein S20|nr:30S ribosomal protein S20 [Elusimicrobiaceae bacterium]MBT3955038.1 30S ribosomal protein S20 [Elusimicrobiaceae bacterium]MBT4008070.1 30S ribosomal protein S20 [Elusimicrobiaceae bacterium]
MAKLKTGRHTSGLKAHRQSEKRASANRGIKTLIKNSSKAVLENKDDKSLNKASSVIDKATKKGLLHWKTAARKKSRLASKVKTEKAVK